MRGFLSYVLIGIVIVIAMDAIVPPAGLGLATGAWPAAEPKETGQVVDRAHKSDRLPAPLANGRRMIPSPVPAVLVGCEPVFSSLSASSRANFSGRCIA
jgi:hypothetical protein